MSKEELFHDGQLLMVCVLFFSYVNIDIISCTVYGSSMIGNHGYQVILGNILKNPLLVVNLSEVYIAMKDEVTLRTCFHIYLI